MLNASVESMSRDLHEYGEGDTAQWILTASDEQLVRVCSVADWLLYHGPSLPSGGSMMIARACALAAVYVREGAPRDLARGRRKRIADPPPLPSPGRRPNYRPSDAASTRVRRRRRLTGFLGCPAVTDCREGRRNQHRPVRDRLTGAHSAETGAVGSRRE